MLKQNGMWFVLGSMVILLVYLEFAPNSVTYLGQNGDWEVKLEARLVSNVASNILTIGYLGEGTITEAQYHIWPLARSGMLLLDAEDNRLPPRERLTRWKQTNDFREFGLYVERCEGEHCEYFDNEKELLFTILWLEDTEQEHRLERLTLKRTKKWFK